MLESDRWLSVSLEAHNLSHHRQMTEEDPLALLKKGKSLLLVGTSRGYLAILNPLTGKVLCSIHGETGVCKEMVEGNKESKQQEEVMEEEEEVNEVLVIACNSGRSQVVTAGKGE